MEEKEIGCIILRTLSSIIVRDIAFHLEIPEEKFIDAWNQIAPPFVHLRMRKWHVIEGFPNFEVSNDGIVRNTKTKNYIETRIQEDYNVVTLCYSQNGIQMQKFYRVNILVATYFIHRPEGTQIVHHKNGNKLDNREENLEWVTYKKNTKEWHKTRDYTNEIEQYKDGELIRTWKSTIEILDVFKSYRRNGITRCCNGRRETYRGFVWKWVTARKEKVSDEELKENYVEIGVVKGWNFSGSYIKKDGRGIVGKMRIEKEIFPKHGYDEVGLCDTDGVEHKLSLHKLINQILKGGRYEDEIDHKDRIRNNNDKENLEVVSHRENMIRVAGKAVKQINIESGNVIETFRCMSDAYRKLGRKRHSDIADACNGRQKTAFGYRWEWV
jgi:HNH endonuclease